MADLSSAIQVVNDLVVRLDRLTDASEIGLIALRLDFLHRMLVNLDVDQDITDTLGSLCSNAAAIYGAQLGPLSLLRQITLSRLVFL